MQTVRAAEVTRIKFAGDAEFRLFVISGGPGSGKTTVLRVLENLRFWRRYIASAYMI